MNLSLLNNKLNVRYRPGNDEHPPSITLEIKDYDQKNPAHEQLNDYLFYECGGKIRNNKHLWRLDENNLPIIGATIIGKTSVAETLLALSKHPESTPDDKQQLNNFLQEIITLKNTDKTQPAAAKDLPVSSNLPQTDITKSTHSVEKLTTPKGKTVFAKQQLGIISEIESFSSELFRLLLGEEAVAKARPSYDASGFRSGVLSNEIKDLTHLEQALINQGYDANFIRKLIDKGYGKQEAANHVFAEYDAHWQNAGFNDKETLVRFDFDRTLWPLTAQYAGFSTPEADADFPVHEDDIRQLPKYSHSLPDNSLQSELTVFFPDNYSELIDFIQQDPVFTQDKWYTYLKYLLISQDMYNARLHYCIRSTKKRNEFLHFLEARKSAFEIALVSMPEFRQYLQDHPEAIEQILGEFSELNKKYENHATPEKKALFIDTDNVKYEYRMIRVIANLQGLIHPDPLDSVTDTIKQLAQTLLAAIYSNQINDISEAEKQCDAIFASADISFALQCHDQFMQKQIQENDSIKHLAGKLSDSSNEITQEEQDQISKIKIMIQEKKPPFNIESIPLNDGNTEQVLRDDIIRYTTLLRMKIGNPVQLKWQLNITKTFLSRIQSHSLTQQDSLTTMRDIILDPAAVFDAFEYGGMIVTKHAPLSPEFEGKYNQILDNLENLQLSAEAAKLALKSLDEELQEKNQVKPVEEKVIPSRDNLLEKIATHSHQFLSEMTELQTRKTDITKITKEFHRRLIKLNQQEQELYRLIADKNDNQFKAIASDITNAQDKFHDLVYKCIANIVHKTGVHLNHSEHDITQDDALGQQLLKLQAIKVNPLTHEYHLDEIIEIDTAINGIIHLTHQQLDIAKQATELTLSLDKSIKKLHQDKLSFNQQQNNAEQKKHNPYDAVIDSVRDSLQTLEQIQTLRHGLTPEIITRHQDFINAIDVNTTLPALLSRSNKVSALLDNLHLAMIRFPYLSETLPPLRTQLENLSLTTKDFDTQIELLTTAYHDCLSSKINDLVLKDDLKQAFSEYKRIRDQVNAQVLSFFDNIFYAQLHAEKTCIALLGKLNQFKNLGDRINAIQIADISKNYDGQDLNQDDGLESNEDYDFVLYTASNEEITQSLDFFKKIKMLSEENNFNPVLIKQEKRILIYGASDQGWRIKPLNDKDSFNKINFPAVNHSGYDAIPREATIAIAKSRCHLPIGLLPDIQLFLNANQKEVAETAARLNTLIFEATDIPDLTEENLLAYYIDECTKQYHSQLDYRENLLKEKTLIEKALSRNKTALKGVRIKIEKHALFENQKNECLYYEACLSQVYNIKRLSDELEEPNEFAIKAILNELQNIKSSWQEDKSEPEDITVLRSALDNFITRLTIINFTSFTWKHEIQDYAFDLSDYLDKLTVYLSVLTQQHLIYQDDKLVDNYENLLTELICTLDEFSRINLNYVSSEKITAFQQSIHRAKLANDDQNIRELFQRHPLKQPVIKTSSVRENPTKQLQQEIRKKLQIEDKPAPVEIKNIATKPDIIKNTLSKPAIIEEKIPAPTIAEPLIEPLHTDRHLENYVNQFTHFHLIESANHLIFQAHANLHSTAPSAKSQLSTQLSECELLLARTNALIKKHEAENNRLPAEDIHAILKAKILLTETIDKIKNQETPVEVLRYNTGQSEYLELNETLTLTENMAKIQRTLKKNNAQDPETAFMTMDNHLSKKKYFRMDAKESYYYEKTDPGLFSKTPTEVSVLSGVGEFNDIYFGAISFPKDFSKLNLRDKLIIAIKFVKKTYAKIPTDPGDENEFALSEKTPPEFASIIVTYCKLSLERYKPPNTSQVVISKLSTHKQMEFDEKIEAYLRDPNVITAALPGAAKGVMLSAKEYAERQQEENNKMRAIV